MRIKTFNKSSGRALRPSPPRGGQAPRPCSGQAMILTVLLMGGMLMMMTAIAGLLMFYQIRQSGDAGRSTMAIFAADAGLERASYFLFRVITPDKSPQCNTEDASGQEQPCTAAMGGVFADWLANPDGFFSNGASYTARVLIPTDASGVSVVTASGKDAGQRTVRVVQTSFNH